MGTSCNKYIPEYKLKILMNDYENMKGCDNLFKLHNEIKLN